MKQTRISSTSFIPSDPRITYTIGSDWAKLFKWLIRGTTNDSRPALRYIGVDKTRLFSSDGFTLRVITFLNEFLEPGFYYARLLSKDTLTFDRQEENVNYPDIDKVISDIRSTPIPVANNQAKQVTVSFNLTSYLLDSVMSINSKTIMPIHITLFKNAMCVEFDNSCYCSGPTSGIDGIESIMAYQALAVNKKTGYPTVGIFSAL